MAPKPETSTAFAILGLLSLAPMSGYDIRKEVATSIGYFWSESYGQIYPALRRLHSTRLIRRLPLQSGGGRERQVYEITKRGMESLRAWRSMPPRPTPVRSELLLKLFFGEPDSPSHEIEWVERVLTRETEHLEAFRLIRRQLKKERSRDARLPFWLITLSYGEHRSRATIRWCRATLVVLQKLAYMREKATNGT